MSDPHVPPPVNPLAERIETALVEATRDLKAFTVRELSAQQAQQEQRFDKRLADMQAELEGLGVKLVAIRNEFHQTLRDQTQKLSVLALAALALAVAAIVFIVRALR